jgi:hypothetical protein
MSLLMSQLVSVRVPTCPLERAKLAMSDTIFRDRFMREELGGSVCEPPMVRYAQYQWLPPNVCVSRAEQPTRTLDCRQTIENRKCLLNVARVRRRLDAMLGCLCSLGTIFQL